MNPELPLQFEVQQYNSGFFFLISDADRVGFHDKIYEATGEPLALSSVGTAEGASKLLLKLHGCFMVVAWIGTSSIGIVLARLENIEVKISFDLILETDCGNVLPCASARQL